MCGGALAACVAAMNTRHNKTIRQLAKPKTIMDMLDRLLKMKSAGQYHSGHIHQILDNVSLTSEMGTENVDQLVNMMPRFHWGLGMFAIPTWEWVGNFSVLLKNKRVLDFGAGVGIITAMLKDKGVEVRAIDNNNRELPKLIDTMIIDEGVKYVREHKDEYDVLFLAWPEMNETCLDVCNIFCGEGKKVYYLGEGEGGCTASDKFFETFDLKYLDIGYAPLFGLHDFVYEVKRRVPNAAA